MKKLTAVTLGMVVAILMMPGVVHAQNVIAIRGTIQAADCQANTLTLKAVDDSLRVFATASSTAVFVNSAAADSCALPRYAGSDATVWITAAGDQLVAGRVDIWLAPAPVVPEPVPGYGYGPYYGRHYGPYFYPFLDIGIDFDPRFHDRGFDRDRDFRDDREFDRDRHLDRERHAGGDRDFHGSGGSSGGGMHRGFHGGTGGHGGGR